MKIAYVPSTLLTMDNQGHWQYNGWSGPEGSQTIPDGSMVVVLDAASVPTLRQFIADHECTEDPHRRCCHYMLRGDGEFVYDEKKNELVRVGMCNCGGIRVRRAYGHAACIFTRHIYGDIPNAYDPDSIEYVG